MQGDNYEEENTNDVVSPSDNNKTFGYPPENDRQEEDDPVVSPSDKNKTFGYPPENDRQDKTINNTIAIRRVLDDGERLCADIKEKTQCWHLLGRRTMELRKDTLMLLKIFK